MTMLHFRAAMNPTRMESSSSINEEAGGPGESRTPDKRFRKPLLYPSELQARRNGMKPEQSLADWSAGNRGECLEWINARVFLMMVMMSAAAGGNARRISR